MKNRRRFTLIAASLAIIAVFLFSLPTFLCLEPVFRRTLNLLNSRLPGTLEIQSCSLGWRQGLDCQGLRYQEPELGIRVTVPRLIGDKGLFLLLAAPQYLGELHLNHPLLTFLSAPIPPVSRANAGNPAALGQPTTLAAEHGTAGRTRWWERLTFRFKVDKGVVERDQGLQSKQELARDVDLKGSLAAGTVNYALAFRAGLEQEGHLRIEGLINLPTARPSRLDTLVSRTEVAITGLEISDFLDLAADMGDFPRGGGVLDATCHVVTAGIEHLEVDGETRLRGLRLSGGFLGQDHPAFDHLHFTFKGHHRSKEGWQLAAFNLDSDPVQIQANGRYDRTAASLTAQGIVNVPALAEQLPHLLSLQEKTKFTEGLVDFSLHVAGTSQELEMKADCQTGRLAVVHNGQAFSWDAPLSLVAKADRRQGKTTVRTLQAHLPFLDLQGRGGADDFTLRATADLDRMFTELKKIFAFNFNGTGKMEVTGSSKMQTDGRYRLDTRIGIKGFALSRGGTSLLSSHDFLLSGEAWTPPSFFQYGSFTSLRVDGASHLGAFSLFAQNNEEHPGNTHTSCSVHGRIDLGRMSDFFLGLAGAVSPVRLGGMFTFDTAGWWKENRLSLKTLEGGIEQLSVIGQGYAYHEPQVAVSLGNKAVGKTPPVRVRGLMIADNWQDFIEKEQPGILIDFDRQSLNLRHLNLEAADTSVRGNVSLENWRQPLDLAAAITGESDAALLVPFLKKSGWLSEDMAVKGRAQVSLRTGSSGEREALTDLIVQVEPFELFRLNKKVFRDPRLRLQATLQGALGGEGDMKIPAVWVQTAPLQVEGTGLLHRRPPFSLELQGTLLPDLAYFAKVLSSATGQNVALAGKGQGTFLLALPCKGPFDLSRTTLSARLPVDSFQYLGVHLRKIEIPIDLNRGILGAIIAGKLKGGKVDVQPQWTFDSRYPVVRLPSPSQVLQDVPLRQALLNGMLARMHPFFGVLAQPEGTVDLRVNDFSSLLIAKRTPQPAFKATIGLKKIHVVPTKVLKDILDQAGIEHESLQLKESELACEGKAGRIACTPLHLLAGDIEVAISGTVGRDGTVASLIHLPVTERLAETVQCPLPQGSAVSVNAEVVGTQNAPFFDAKAFLARVSSELGEAVKEQSGLKPE